MNLRNTFSIVFDYFPSFLAFKMLQFFKTLSHNLNISFVQIIPRYYGPYLRIEWKIRNTKKSIIELYFFNKSGDTIFIKILFHKLSF